MGLGSKEIVLLVLTAVVSMLTFGSGRATVLQATHHLAVFAAFIFLALVLGAVWMLYPTETCSIEILSKLPYLCAR